MSCENAISWIYGANLSGVLHRFSSLTRFKGSRGQLWPKTDPKQQNTKIEVMIFQYFICSARSAYVGPAALQDLGDFWVEPGVRTSRGRTVANEPLNGSIGALSALKRINRGPIGP